MAYSLVGLVAVLLIAGLLLKSVAVGGIGGVLLAVLLVALLTGYV